MKILVVASILYRDGLKEEYTRIVNFIKRKNVVLGEQVLTFTMEEVYTQPESKKREYLNLFKKQIIECDVVVAEVTFPSTVNIGFEVAYALQRNKAVIAMYKKDKYYSTILEVLETDKLLYVEYNNENLEKVLQDALDFVDKKSESRFNFYLPSDQADYIDNMSKKDNVTRTAALRKIISESMGKSEAS